MGDLPSMQTQRHVREQGIRAMAVFAQAVTGTISGILGRRSRRCFLAVAVMLLCMGNRIDAQGSTNATVLGTVTDSGGAVVPNATVQVKNVETGQARQVTTDGQGRYTAADLPVVNYEAQATAQGFQ